MGHLLRVREVLRSISERMPHIIIPDEVRKRNREVLTRVKSIARDLEEASKAGGWVGVILHAVATNVDHWVDTVSKTRFA